MTSRRVAAAIFLAVAGVVVWVASRMTWIVVESVDDKSGDKTSVVVGSLWSSELVAVALLLFVCAVAALALRPMGRRVAGVIGALAGVGASWQALGLLTGEPDASRVRSLLTVGDSAVGGAAQSADQVNHISQWADIVSVEPQVWGPVVALLGCALAVVSGVVVALRPGVVASGDRYERAAYRSTDAAEAEDDDASRALWDALDADIDPTRDN